MRSSKSSTMGKNRYNFSHPKSHFLGKLRKLFATPVACSICQRQSRFIFINLISFMSVIVIIQLEFQDFLASQPTKKILFSFAFGPLSSPFFILPPRSWHIILPKLVDRIKAASDSSLCRKKRFMIGTFSYRLDLSIYQTTKIEFELKHFNHRCSKLHD